MSALGQKQTCAAQKVMSALTPKADMCGALAYVCFVPILLKNSALAAAAKRDSIDVARIDGGDDDGRAFGIAGAVFLPICS